MSIECVTVIGLGDSYSVETDSVSIVINTCPPTFGYQGPGQVGQVNKLEDRSGRKKKPKHKDWVLAG